jgi:uncharacterized protein involved in exopolysaccharide biosynthesis
MSADLNAEREVDLARWRRALAALWWLPVAGLVLGAIVGYLFAVGGSSHYKASALISLGQPVSPGGVVIASYNTNPRAISEITSSAAAQEQAAKAAGMHPGALRGNVSVGVVGTQTGTGAARTAPLISVTVGGKVGRKTEDAANALARIVVADTTAPYVGKKIATYQSVLRTTDTQLASINTRLSALQKAVAKSNLAPLDQLVLISQVDNAEQRQGNLLDQKATTEQQLAFAQNVESAKIVTPAASVLSTAHSKKTSVVIGALIGLLIGAIVAIVGYDRIPRFNRG